MESFYVTRSKRGGDVLQVSCLKEFVFSEIMKATKNNFPEFLPFFRIKEINAENQGEFINSFKSYIEQEGFPSEKDSRPNKYDLGCQISEDVLSSMLDRYFLVDSLGRELCG